MTPAIVPFNSGRTYQVHRGTAASGPARRGPYRRGVAYLVVGLAAVATTGVVAPIFLGGQVKTALQSQSVPLCVIAADGPLGGFEADVPGATVAECDAELASAREGFRADSSASTLSIVHVLPSGTPDCVVGITQMFTYGLTADTLASQVCS